MAGPQRNRTSCQSKCVTLRHYVTGRARLLDAAFGHLHCLSRKPLQPEDAREEEACHHPLIGLEGHGMRILRRRDKVSKEMLDMPPRARLLAMEMLRDPHHSLANQQFVRVAPTRRDAAEFFRQFQNPDHRASADVNDHRPQSERSWYSASSRLSAIARAFVQAVPIS